MSFRVAAARALHRVWVSLFPPRHRGEEEARREFVNMFPSYAHTWDWEEHPEDYDDVCMCATCRSYCDG